MKRFCRALARSLGLAGPTAETGVSRATLRGGAYLAGRYGAGVLVSLGNMLVMTWWIGPHAYGVYVTAISLVAFLANLTRAGVDTYLVRREDAPDETLYAIGSTVILAISAGLAILGALATPLLTRWFHSGEFTAPYLVLLLNVPLIGLTGIPVAKLERELNFKKVAGIELAGQSLSLAVGIVLAAAGCKVWAPVVGQLAWQAFILVAASLGARLSIKLQFERNYAREMLSYGVGLTMSMRTWQLRTLVNPLLVGRFAGVEAVAFVAFAIRVAEGLGSLRLAAGRLAIAALSRLQRDRDEFERTLQRALQLQLITLGPLLCGFALVGPWVIAHIVGRRWMASLAVYPFIASGVLVNSVFNLQASALFVVGRQWTVMRSYVVHVILLAGATALLLPRMGLAGYGWAELLACASYVLIQGGLAGRIKVSYGKLAPQVATYMALLFAPAVVRAWSAGIT